MNIETGEMAAIDAGALVAELAREESTEAFLARYSETLRAIVTRMAEQGATQDQMRGYVREFANGAWVRREELSQHHTWASTVPEGVVESAP